MLSIIGMRNEGHKQMVMDWLLLLPYGYEVKILQEITAGKIA
jgi:hypothetical protein